MRVAAALVLLMVGCTDGDAPPLLVTDFGVPSDAAPDLIGAGASCTTACDCTPGLACRMNVCEAASVPVFCCGTPACTDGNLCEFSDGTVAQCGTAGDGGGTPVDVDAGATPMACRNTPCVVGPGGNAFCKLVCGASSATCVKGPGGIEHCMP